MPTLTKAIKGKYACEHFWIPIVQRDKPEVEDAHGASDSHDEAHGGGNDGHKRKRRGVSEAETNDDNYEVKKAIDGVEQPYIWTEYFGDKTTAAQALQVQVEMELTQIPHQTVWDSTTVMRKHLLRSTTVTQTSVLK